MTRSEMVLLVGMVAGAVVAEVLAAGRVWWRRRCALWDRSSQRALDVYAAGCSSDFGLAGFGFDGVVDEEESAQDRLLVAESMPGEVAAFHPAVVEAEQVMADAVRTFIPHGPAQRLWFVPLQRDRRAE